MNIELSDEYTRNLYNGMMLILKNYPNASISLGDNFDNNLQIYIVKDDSRLSKEDTEQLISWGWKQFITEIFVSWEFES